MFSIFILLDMSKCIKTNLRLDDLKDKIEKETTIDKLSQLIIYNNLLFDSLVTDQQTIETFPIIDKEHPLVLFSLSKTLSCDNLEIIKERK